MTTIIVTQEDGEVDEFDFGPDTLVIGLGRRTTNEVCIPDRSVSANHARITFDGGSAWVEDLDSTNGTYINGRLVSRQRLENSDEIILGKIRVTFTRDPADESTRDAATTSGSAGSKGAADASASEHADDASGDRSEDDLAAMSLSEKARVALGRETAARPHLQAVAPRRRETDGDASARDDRPVPVADRPPAASPATQVASPRPRPVAPALGGGHPLDGLEDELAKQPMHELDNDRTPSRGAVIEIKNGAKSGQILPIDKPVTTLGRPGIQIAAIMRKPDGYFLMHIESDDSVERPTLNRDSIGDEPVLLHSGDELNVAGIDVEFMLS